jgi:hypothetical protein
MAPKKKVVKSKVDDEDWDKILSEAKLSQPQQSPPLNPVFIEKKVFKLKYKCKVL